MMEDQKRLPFDFWIDDYHYISGLAIFSLRKRICYDEQLHGAHEKLRLNVIKSVNSDNFWEVCNFLLVQAY